MADAAGGGPAAAPPAASAVDSVEIDVMAPAGGATSGRDGDRAKSPPAASETVELAPDLERELDIANIVTSAAKGVTTVQEAPAIITILTADEIRSRSFRDLLSAVATVPGWQRVGAYYNEFDMLVPRGVVQATLLLRDGVSLFDPYLNIAAVNRSVPLEAIKRIEIITGPGGVLWGANSFLGILNLITKDAEDVNGLEVSAGYGDGPGDRSAVRAYAMYGGAFLKKRLKWFQHLSFESFVGPEYTLPGFFLHSPAPQPPGPSYYAGLLTSDLPRSYLVVIDGKLSMGPFSIIYSAPLGDFYRSGTFGGSTAREDFPGAEQVDPGRLGRSNRLNMYDRYVIGEYRSRLANDRLGLSVKAYYTNFKRQMGPMMIFAPSKLIPGGLSFRVDPTVYRAGVTIDGDVSLPYQNRLLFGAEAFYESAGNATVTFDSPEPMKLPLACPLIRPDADPNLAQSYLANCPLPFMFDSNRTVWSVFVDDQYRPIPQLTLDVGLRLQAAPATLSKRGYDPVLLLSAAAVWNFLADYHLKLNYAEGFRPPVFNNTDGNGEAVQVAGVADLQVERSRALQAEINARVLRNVRRIRELSIRLDYSYTYLENLIQIVNGRYQNAGERDIHSVEVLARLYLAGDHYLNVGYTFAHSKTSDRGVFLSSSQSWFSVGAVFSLWRNHLEAVTNLLVLGGFSDPNRLVPAATLSKGGFALFDDLTYDRIPSAPLWHVGLRLRGIWRDRLTFELHGYNILNAKYYQPDVQYDLSARLEQQALPGEGASFFASARFHY